eukprot:15265744-Alexandrium_andersonii.AAC.1
MVVDSLEQHKRSDGSTKPLFKGLADEFVNRITGHSTKAPETALPKHQGVGKPSWEKQAISELKWWEARRIMR